MRGWGRGVDRRTTPRRACVPITEYYTTVGGTAEPWPGRTILLYGSVRRRRRRLDSKAPRLSHGLSSQGRR